MVNMEKFSADEIEALSEQYGYSLNEEQINFIDTILNTDWRGEGIPFDMINASIHNINTLLKINDFRTSGGDENLSVKSLMGEDFFDEIKRKMISEQYQKIRPYLYIFSQGKPQIRDFLKNLPLYEDKSFWAEICLEISKKGRESKFHKTQIVKALASIITGKEAEEVRLTIPLASLLWDLVNTDTPNREGYTGEKKYNSIWNLLNKK